MNFGYVLIGISVTVITWLVWYVFGSSGQSRKRQKITLPAVIEPTSTHQNTEAMDRLWYFDPKTKALVDKARNELPLLYQKMQVLQQQVVGAKVDMNREEGTLFQRTGGGGGILDLVVTGLAAHGMAKSQEKQDNLSQSIATIQAKIDEDEALIARYDDLSVKYAH